VRLSVDHEATRSTDALATVGVERDRFLALGDQVLVDHVEQFEERSLVGDGVHLVRLEVALGGGTVLAPDLEGDVPDETHL